ncbi:MAG: hypothetical protein Q9182_007556 [Xanthomendoza sp. 2 TL-2023]
MTVADPGPTSAAEPDDISRRRYRRKIESRILVARDAPVITQIGTCKLAKPVNIPLFLSYGSAMKLNNQRNGYQGANGKIYDEIEKWYGEDLATDGKDFSWTKSPNPFSDPNHHGSIDHVWEKSNVVDFLASLLGSEFDCDDLNTLFSCKVKLQTVFDQLPSMDRNNVKSGFAAMNQNLNGMKGWMFSQGFSVPKFGTLYDSDEKVIQGLQRQAIIFHLFNNDGGIQSMHDATNNRIYGAFLALDDFISTNKIQRANGRGDLTQTFGPTFKKWYEDLLNNVGSATYGWASGEVARLGADTSLSGCLRKAIDAFQSSGRYGQDKFKIDQSHLTWKETPITLKRSLVARDDTCILPTNTSGTITRTVIPLPATPTSTGPAPTTTALFPPPTTLLSTTKPSSLSTKPSSVPSTSRSSPGRNCFVPAGCKNVRAPDGCAIVCS